MPITGTHIAYLHTCHRKLWLFAHSIQMEHTSQVVAEGKLIGETSYAERAQKYTELAIDGIKIDFYDAKNKVVHEVKKSDKVEKAHIAQVKYYLYILAKNGMPHASAIIEYPKMRQKEIVEWQEEDQSEVEEWIKGVEEIMHQNECPPLVKLKICKKCSYYDFCYSGELTE
ncbi:CRISPR-associated protein Cas4 [Marivirga sp. S37H4]|uniref:CRISPR-associated exonuclease Cas4 n=1 Tax=Marivirga aurantiaca TaxID=2802615 RepID=A0A934WVE4_9BACT|nr:CRISPR-associated protein Cas4 [Marivirga aurantiaca]MBK6263641.1 CRISPR-associated protein Cas4 [Marivirga aurantiaca]